MCGISGYFLVKNSESSVDKILQMNRAISHRGPDDEGVTLILPENSFSLDMITSDSEKGLTGIQAVENVRNTAHRIAFGHRRFSIIDITPAGHQPFWSHNRQVCVNYNGEIFNYIELRAELKSLGHIFYTDTDTEVLVEAYLEWGTDCFSRFNGFWAFSLFDTKKKAVLLARDRIGKAPLYVARTAEGVWWSSEIKGIFAATGTFTFKVRDSAVTDFILYGRRDVFHKTFYEGIETFPNSSFAWIESDGSYHPEKYWELPKDRFKEGQIDQPEAVEKFRNLLFDSLKIRMRADVPVGFELSGGMDSSALVGLAAHGGIPIRVFTVSFPGMASDEEPFARKVVEQFRDRIQYTILLPPEEDFFERADQFIWLMEEPFHFPNLLTNQGTWRAMAERGIRVSINGAAGDELLAGYAAYYHLPYLQYLMRKGQWSKLIKEFLMFSEKQTGQYFLGYLRRFYHLLPSQLRLLHNRSLEIPSSIDPFLKPSNERILSGPSEEIEQRLKDNMGDWLMNYWMRAGNKSSMGVPIELRTPFLDYRLIDFVFTLPLNYLIRDGWFKWILRESVKDILPAEVVWRKVKGGFPFPYQTWFVASKDRLLEMIGKLDCPYIDLSKLHLAYSELTRQNPFYLWRIISLALWWKKCIMGIPLK